MTQPWWAELAPTELEVACGPTRHHLGWDAGVLTAPDHPDPERERALVALGADPARCLELIDTWRRHSDDLAVLALATRGPADPLTRVDPAGGSFGWTGHLGMSVMPARYVPMSRARGWTAFAPHPHHFAGPGDDAGHGLEALLRLEGGLPDRLVATVISTWAERLDAVDDRVDRAAPALRAALYGRVVATIHAWTGGHDAVALTMGPPGSQARVTRSATGFDVTLPFSWLRDVWVPGFATVLGRFCVSAVRDGEREWRLSTVGTDVAAARTMTVRLD